MPGGTGKMRAASKEGGRGSRPKHLREGKIAIKMILLDINIKTPRVIAVRKLLIKNNL